MAVPIARCPTPKSWPDTLSLFELESLNLNLPGRSTSIVTPVAVRAIGDRNEFETLTVAVPKPISRPAIVEVSDAEKAATIETFRKTLELCSIQNKEKAISEPFLDEMYKQAFSLCKIVNVYEFLEILDLLSQYLHNESLGIYEVFVEHLLETKEGNILSKYVDFHDLILSPDGIKEIIKFFITKYGFDEKIFSCEGSADIPRLLEEVFTDPADNVRGFIVYDSSKKNSHVTPVFIQKKDGKIQILITDSVGQQSYFNPKGCLAGPLAFLEVVKFLNSNADRYPLELKVYTFGPKRQHDQGACSAYSLLDLKNIFERLSKRDIFEFIELNGETTKKDGVFNPKLQVFEFNYLPPDMMAETQSLRHLHKYTRISPTFRSSSPSSDDLHQASLRDLCDTVNESTVVDKYGNLANKLMDRQRMDLVTRLFKQLLDIV